MILVFPISTPIRLLLNLVCPLRLGFIIQLRYFSPLVTSFIPVIPDVLYCLAKHQIIHQLEEVLLKVIFCIFSQLCILIDRCLQLCFLIKLDDPVNLFQHPATLQHLIKCSDIYHILLLVPQYLHSHLLC